ncbi:MAG: HesB/IscA family protein [Halobacteriaceae archaeon]
MSTDTHGGGEGAVLRVTEDAAKRALDLLAEEGHDADSAGLRLYVEQGGCAGLSYGLCFEETPSDEDAELEWHGLRVFVDPASQEYVAGSVVDFEGGLQGAGFYVQNPNAEGECGCGESFRT